MRTEPHAFLFDGIPSVFRVHGDDVAQNARKRTNYSTICP